MRHTRQMDHGLKDPSEFQKFRDALVHYGFRKLSQHTHRGIRYDLWGRDNDSLCFLAEICATGKHRTVSHATGRLGPFTEWREFNSLDQLADIIEDYTKAERAARP
jgi:hypothetical protein